MDSLRKKPVRTPSINQRRESELRARFSHPAPQPMALPKQSAPRAISSNQKLNPSKNPSSKKKTSLWKKMLLSLFFIILAFAMYFAWKIYDTSQNIRLTSENETEASPLSQIQSIAASLITKKHTPLKGEREGRINILLLGKAGVNHPGKNLTDTVMIMSIDTETKKIALLSLPRDLYVRIPETSLFTKINAIYQQGLSQGSGAETIKASVETITDLPIHYFFIIDFDGFEKVIDTLGGVNVEVERDLYDPRYPGPNYSYETFEIKKGWQILDGKTALKYVRERHNDPEGDFGRAKRQQQVIQAVKNKAFSVETFMNVFTLNNLLDVLGENIKTDIAPDEIESFIALSKQVDTRNITNVVIDAWKPDSLLRVSHIFVGPTRMFILVPRVGNYSEIQDVSAHIFDLNAIKRRQEAIASEQSNITIINRSGNASLAYKIQKILRQDLGFGEVQIATPDSTSETQNDSFIIDKTNQSKPFSLDEILKKFPAILKKDTDVSITETLESSHDFIFVLGNSLAGDLDFEEDSLDDFKQSENDDIAYPKDIAP